ncbi:hypothetical protein [Kordia sp. SMS9]|uniref:hypothetical protein n=1 Tax=Kordia sp. SMS9 TaxID=2282170 RepID=UPI0013B40A95|nr:hypothetical protein [Kordia sp. SMS9]
MKKRKLTALKFTKESVSSLAQQTIVGGGRSFNPPCASFSCRNSNCLTYCDSQCP